MSNIYNNSRYDVSVTDNGNNNYTIAVFRLSNCFHGMGRHCLTCPSFPRQTTFIHVQLDGTPEALQNLMQSIDQQSDTFQQPHTEQIDYWRQQSLGGDMPAGGPPQVESLAHFFNGVRVEESSDDEEGPDEHDLMMEEIHREEDEESLEEWARMMQDDGGEDRRRSQAAEASGQSGVQNDQPVPLGDQVLHPTPSSNLLAVEDNEDVRPSVDHVEQQRRIVSDSLERHSPLL